MTSLQYVLPPARSLTIMTRIPIHPHPTHPPLRKGKKGQDKHYRQIPTLPSQRPTRSTIPRAHARADTKIARMTQKPHRRTLDFRIPTKKKEGRATEPLKSGRARREIKSKPLLYIARAIYPGARRDGRRRRPICLLCALQRELPDHHRQSDPRNPPDTRMYIAIQKGETERQA